MQLSKANLAAIVEDQSSAYDGLINLPEKVLQFGTGVLLRALPDYFIDKANKQGVFNGRILVVKSTQSDSSAFDRQDGLFTICASGIQNGMPVEENSINASISRVVSAQTEWNEILQAAANPNLSVIISNTTEVGIQLVDDSIQSNPPKSFPGKLLAFLYERYRVLGNSLQQKIVVIPTELLPDNGAVLKSIVVELAHRNQVDVNFMGWLEQQVIFCNSLVDRIVPGKPAQPALEALQQKLGYTDELLTVCEIFRLWVIEGNEEVKNILSFSVADTGMMIVPDISIYKELKLRLLNGTHTFNSATAFLCGFEITRDAVLHEVYGKFIRKIMLEEIAPSIPIPIADNLKQAFAETVIDRFLNPFISHHWQSVNVQITSKMKTRNIPLLLHHYVNSKQVPELMATSFAAYLLYMKVERMHGNQYWGIVDGKEYLIKDDCAAILQSYWKLNNAASVAEKVLSDINLWGTDLTQLPGWLAAVQQQLENCIQKGVLQVVQLLLTQKSVVYVS